MFALLLVIVAGISRVDACLFSTRMPAAPAIAHSYTSNAIDLQHGHSVAEFCTHPMQKSPIPPPPSLRRAPLALITNLSICAVLNKPKGPLFIEAKTHLTLSPRNFAHFLSYCPQIHAGLCLTEAIGVMVKLKRARRLRGIISAKYGRSRNKLNFIRLHRSCCPLEVLKLIGGVSFMLVPTR